MQMRTEELARLMKKVEEKGIDWKEVEKEIQTPKQLLDLYLRSGPVPVTIINKLKQIVESDQ